MNPSDEVHRLSGTPSNKEKLHPPRPRIAGEPMNVLCRSLLLKLGNLLQRLDADIIFGYRGSKNGVPVQQQAGPKCVGALLLRIIPSWEVYW